MSTTLDELNTGSSRFVYVVAIEGYDKLLTDHVDTAAVMTAWSGTDHVSCLSGLTVEVPDEQRIDPYESFTEGGTCILRVAPDADDTFGIDTHKRAGGAETTLAESLTRSDAATISVASTTSFAASGMIHIGTEAISYTGKTDNSFTGCTRGKWSAFETGTGNPFTHDHRIDTDLNGVLLQPAVTSLRRTWHGRWVAVYAHRVVAGVLDVKTEALLVFAGKLVDLDDSGKLTTIECKHVLDVIRETAIGTALWSATVPDGIYLFSPQRFRMRDREVEFIGGVRQSHDLANDLTVVSGTATGPNQMPEGYYTADDLFPYLEAWWAAELSAGRINGTYTIEQALNEGAGIRTIIHADIPGADPDFQFALPKTVAKFLGFAASQWREFGANPYPGDPASLYVVGDDGDNIALDPPLRTFVDKFSNNGIDELGLNFEVRDQRGEFVEQFDHMPMSLRLGQTTPGLDSNGDPMRWGIFIFDDNVLVRAAYRESTNEILNAAVVPGGFGSTLTPSEFNEYAVQLDDSARTITIRQILVLEAPAALLLKQLFYSTGTESYNHLAAGPLTFDVLASTVGLGVPGELLGSTFETSANSLPGWDQRLAIVVDKATTIGDLLGGDLHLRRSFLRWHQGKIAFGSWQLPTVDDATLELDEENKAVAAGNDDDQRASSRYSDEWAVPSVKIYFDRDLTDLSRENFRGYVPIEDSTAVDDAGGESRVFTVKSKNTFADGTEVGASMGDILSNYVATFTMFSRPGRRITRPVSPALFNQLYVGQIVTVTDSSLRDEETGQRGIAGIPATVVGKNVDVGGAVHDSDQPQDIAGTVDLFIPDGAPRSVGAVYAPSADVDASVNTGGFTAGYNNATKTIRCYGYRYQDDGSVIAPTLTDAEWFPAGSKVIVIERDPEDPSAPQAWSREVVSQSSDDITLDLELSGFDTSKLYRVNLADYGAVATIQRTKVFQADDTDLLVEDTASAYQYASWPAGASQFIQNMNATIGIELPADRVYSDGAARDVGTEQALARLIDAFIDYKGALSLPVVGEIQSNENDAGGTWQLLQVIPIFLGSEVLSNDVYRELSLQPRYRSQNGSSISLRATLTRTQPTGSTVVDVNRGAIISTATWTTTSTTWQDGARIEVDCRVKDFSGWAWILLEGTLYCETRGLVQVKLGPRIYEDAWWVPI